MLSRLTRWFKWFAPGMRIKRWLCLATLGGVIFSAGLLMAADVIAERARNLIGNPPLQEFTGMVLMVLGLILVVWALRRFFLILSSAVASHPRKQLVEVLYDRRYLDQGLKLVAIGGGTGLSTLLRGLKSYTSNVTAVVAVSDDGGSSGKLRQELGVLAPGDVRNCLVALADDESLLKELFRYRFAAEGGLEGHSFGNLFLAALTDLAGDFEVAIQLSSQILAVRGRVLPATLSPVNLAALYSDGSVVTGESRIPKHSSQTRIERISLEPANVRPPEPVLEALRQADAIILGPGSLYTSVIPNLLVPEIAQAIRESAAPRIYVCNVMTQPGETDGMGAADHVEALQAHADVALDYVIVNLGDPEKLAEKYKAEGALPVDPQLERLAALRVEGVGTALISETNWVRHDPEALAATLMDLIARHRGRDSKERGTTRLRLVK